MTNKPWLSEPNELLWTDYATGLKCLIWRNPSLLFLCGYVAVPADHPLHGSNCETLEAHGGITFTGQVNNKERLSVADGIQDSDYFVGFDTGHFDDYAPYLALYGMQDRGIYRNWAFVKAEVEALAKQIKEYKS